MIGRTAAQEARLKHLTLRWPYLGDKSLLVDLVKNAAHGDLGMAMELAYKYLAYVRVERTYAPRPLAFHGRVRVSVSYLWTAHITL